MPTLLLWLLGTVLGIDGRSAFHTTCEDAEPKVKSSCPTP